MKGPIPDPPAAPAKVDPETLVLRGSPGRVARFRRGAIIGIAALASSAVIAVTWVALKPATFRIVASNDEPSEVQAKAPPDALANAPSSYGDVPRLGPPLPGDLGRPILEHQRSTGTPLAQSRANVETRALQEAEAERQRVAAERKAARESAVMMQLTAAGEARAASAAEMPSLASPPPSATASPPTVTRDPNEQGRKLAFLEAQDRSGDLNPHGLVPAASPWMLSAGSVIAASLITGLNSDLPGLVTAQVTQNVHDSATGRTLLIPQGSRLIGSYDSVVAFGQERALVVWQRIVLPNGSSVRIDNLPAADTAGYSGLADQLDVHTWQLLKGVALSTVLGLGTELSIGGEGDLVRAIRESTQQNAARAGDQIVSRNLGVQPTVKVRPGWPLRVIVHKDLVLAPWRE